MLLLFKRADLRAGLVLGLGLGAFVDGILLHQILGWHHMICTTGTCQPESIAALQRQITQDGFFHLAAWTLTVAGATMLWRATSNGASAGSGRAIVAASFAGWGLFNLVEGLIDHQLLGLHHVNPASPHWLAYDVGFLLWGAVLMVVGGQVAARSVTRTRGTRRDENPLG